MKCKTWSDNLNNFVVRKLKYFNKINGQQVLNKMPAMSKEKASPVPLASNFAELKMKEQYSNTTTTVTNGRGCGCRSSATTTDTTTNQITPNNQKLVNNKSNYNNGTAKKTTIPTSAANADSNKNTQSPAKQQQQQQHSATKTPPKKTPNDFIFGKYIGEGSFSTVYLAMEIHTNREYAIKVCDKQHILRERKEEYVQRERQVMHMMTNVPGFVNLACTFQDYRSLYFVMTYAKHGDLLPYITKVGSFDLECTRHYAAELVLALEEMHKRGIVHRDLKPENILLDENMHTLIADFGSAKILTDKHPPPPVAPVVSSSTCSSTSSSPASSASSSPANDRITNTDSNTNSTTNNPVRRRKGSFVGTAQYVSPEVLLQNAPIGRSADLWALGCIIYQMISGLPPFRGNNDYYIFREILSCNLEFPEGFDEDAKDLVKSLLKLNADERIGAQDKSGHYESIRSHSFFYNVNWDKVRSKNPPPIYPYLPGNNQEKELRSQYRVPDDLEPGLGDRQRTRLLAYDLGTTIGDMELIEQKTEPKNIYGFSEMEKQRKLEKQMIDDSIWHPFADNEVILKKGYINKRKGLFARRRMLLLTTGPRLIYIDPVAMVKKGEIPWSPELRVEPKNFKIFFIHTPNRTYYLEDPEGYALQWTKTIETVRNKTYEECDDSS